MATIPQLREIGLPKGMGSSSLAATIASLMLEGFYICLFIVTMLFLYQKGVPMRSLSVILIVIIFICNLADAAMDIFTAFQGFVAFRQGPDIYYTLFNTKQVDNSWYAAGDFCFTVAAFCTEVLMCYRMYIVWSPSRQVLYLPFVIIPIGVVGAIALIVFDCKGPKYSSQYMFISEALGFLTIMMTWYYTGLTCYRLWSVERRKRRAVDAINELAPEPSDGLYRLIGEAMIESGLLYSCTQIVYIICYLTSNFPGFIIISYVNIRVVGITTVLIILKWHLASSRRGRPIHHDRRPPSPSLSIPVFRAVDSTRTTETVGDSVLDVMGEAKAGVAEVVSAGGLTLLAARSRGSESLHPSEVTDGQNSIV